jgi:hypothetical protein
MSCGTISTAGRTSEGEFDRDKLLHANLDRTVDPTDLQMAVTTG